MILKINLTLLENFLILFGNLYQYFHEFCPFFPLNNAALPGALVNGTGTLNILLAIISLFPTQF